VITAMASEPPKNSGRAVMRWALRGLHAQVVTWSIVPSVSIRQVRRLFQKIGYLQPR
jgi:hypothetical protein